MTIRDRAAAVLTGVSVIAGTTGGFIIDPAVGLLILSGLTGLFGFLLGREDDRELEG